MFAVGLLAVAAAHAGPGELTLLSEPSMKAVLTAVANDFEKESGQHVALVIAKPGQLASAFKGANHPDVALLSDDLMDKAVQASQVAPDSRRPVGQAGLVLVVRSGASKPDVSSPEALKRVLGNAKSMVLPDPEDNPAGAQAAQLIARLGLADTLKEKTTLGAGANPMAQVSLGAVDLGLHTQHEAMALSGVSVVGLPDAVQPWRRYALAMVTDAPNASEARELIAFMTGAAGRKLLQSKGLSMIP